MNLIEYPGRAALMTGLAKVLETALGTALAQRRDVTFAVPGGTTPGPLFDALAKVPLDWGRVHVLLTDERWVPQSDPASNAALIRQRLLKGPAAAAHFTPYFMPDTDIGTAAQDLSARLKSALPIDVLLLGMGADMHTASLFPQSPDLAAALAPDAPMFLGVDVPGQSTARFTLTAPALRSAGATHLLITGDDKRAAVMQAGILSPEEAPIATVLGTAITHWSAE